MKLFWGDAEHVPDVFAGSGFIAIVPPVDAALDSFGVERVDWLPGSSTKMSKDQRYQDTEVLSLSILAFIAGIFCLAQKILSSPNQQTT